MVKWNLSLPYFDILGLWSGIYPFVKAANMQTTSLPTFNFPPVHILNQSFKVWKETVNHFFDKTLLNVGIMVLFVALDANFSVLSIWEEKQWVVAGPMLTFATNIWSFNFSDKMSGNTIKWSKPGVTLISWKKLEIQTTLIQRFKDEVKDIWENIFKNS